MNVKMKIRSPEICQTTEERIREERRWRILQIFTPTVKTPVTIRQRWRFVKRGVSASPPAFRTGGAIGAGPDCPTAERRP